MIKNTAILLSLICNTAIANTIPEDAFNEAMVLNSQTLRLYKDAAAKEWADLTAVLVADNDKLILYKKGKIAAQIDTRARMKTYHWAKAIAHIPMGLFLLGKDNSLEKQLFEQRLQSLQGYRSDLSCNMQIAVENQRKVLDEAMNEIRANLLPEEQSDLRVIVLGAKQPRKKNLLMSYFRAILKLREEDDTRLLYAENVFDAHAALAVLGGVILDRKISEEFFGSSQKKRLEEDILGDAMQRELDLRSRPPTH